MAVGRIMRCSNKPRRYAFWSFPYVFLPLFFTLPTIVALILFLIPRPVFAMTPEQIEALKQEHLSQLGDAAAAAGTSSGVFRGVLGSPEAMRSKLGNPFTDNVPLSSIDGSESGHINSICAASDKFLNISYQASANGNINVFVRQDLNLDGSFDSSGLYFDDIAGVCANGVAKCQPGWKNCTYYKWAIAPNGSIELGGAFYSDMGACACYNNSCPGSGMVSFPHNDSDMQQTILSELGAGIISLLSQTIPDFRISNAVFGDKEVSFPGTNARACSNKPNLLPDPLVNTDSLTGSYGSGRNDSFLASISSSVIARDTADSNSAWNAMLSMPKTGAANMTPCVIQHLVVGNSIDGHCIVTDNDADYTVSPYFGWLSNSGNTGFSDSYLSVKAKCFDSDGDGAGDTLILSGFFTGQTHSQGSTVRHYSYLNNNTPLYFSLPDKAQNVYHNLGSMQISHAQAQVGLTLQLARNCTLNNCVYTFLITKFTFGGTVWWTDPSNLTYVWDAGDTTSDNISVVVSKNSCDNIENNPDCQLWNETVDSVNGICPSNHTFNPSLLKCISMANGQIADPISSSKTVSGGVVQPGVTLSSYGYRIQTNHTPGCMTYAGGRTHYICEVDNGFTDHTSGVNFPVSSTPPFWQVSRDYKCDSDKEIATVNSDVWKRIDHVTKTTTISGTSVYAEDAPVGGEITSMSATVQGGAGAFAYNEGCSWRCKVQMAPIIDRQSTGQQQTPQTGVTSKNTSPPVTTITTTTVRECRKNNMLDLSESWKCPYNSLTGETLVPINGLECSCVSDDFAKAATAMQFLHDMAEDFRCTP